MPTGRPRAQPHVYKILPLSVSSERPDARNQKAYDVDDPRRLLWETDALTQAAARFRELAPDGLEAVFEVCRCQRNDKAFLARFAQMVRRETGIDIGSISSQGGQLVGGHQGRRAGPPEAVSFSELLVSARPLVTYLSEYSSEHKGPSPRSACGRD